MVKNISLNQFIIILRERTGLTKTELANRLGISFAVIHEVEKGTKKLSLERCVKLLDVFKFESNNEKIAFLESAKKEYTTNYRDAGFDLYIEKLKLQSLGLEPFPNSEFQKIPIISWVHANKFEDISPMLITDEFVFLPIKGKNLFGLKVENDCMEPEFIEGDSIVVNPDLQYRQNSFVVVACLHEDKATLKQYKEYGDKIFLHPLNPKYQDIELDHKKEYKIIGVVVTKFKRYNGM